MRYDTVIRGGVVVDGLMTARRRADIGIADGRIAKIGVIARQAGDREIDAAGSIVAPGVIDVHCHYDAQLHWDPYCTSSGWHGTTTVGIGNCGFGYAPCKPADRDRYMEMMVNTEQVPFDVQKAALPWTWSSFPEWLDHLRALPKGLNVASYLPVNALLLYVMGEEAKTRPATSTERDQMRQLLNEAMDAGACGFAFSLLGNGNGHVDADGSPVPTDLMDPEEVYNLARVLRERGDGVIQSNVEARQECRREISEELARISGRPVIHNVIFAFDLPPNPNARQRAIASRYKDTIAWADACAENGLDIYLQSLTFRTWNEVRATEISMFASIPVFEEFVTDTTDAERLALSRDAKWRKRVRDAYQPEYFMPIGGRIEDYVLVSAQSERFRPYEDKRLEEIGELTNESAVDIFFEAVSESELRAEFKIGNFSSSDPEKIAAMLRHPRVIPGTSDGGAHVKMFVGGHYSTDLLLWLVRDAGTMSLEELHHALSLRPARALNLADRGAIAEGYAADIMIYDLATLGFDASYETAFDLPGGDWRKICRARGVCKVLVNGEVILEERELTSAVPGKLLPEQHQPKAVKVHASDRAPVSAHA